MHKICFFVLFLLNEKHRIEYNPNGVHGQVAAQILPTIAKSLLMPGVNLVISISSVLYADKKGICIVWIFLAVNAGYVNRLVEL